MISINNVEMAIKHLIKILPELPKGILQAWTRHSYLIT